MAKMMNCVLINYGVEVKEFKLSEDEDFPRVIKFNGEYYDFASLNHNTNKMQWVIARCMDL